MTSAQTATASQNGIAPIRTVCPSGEDPPNGPYTRQPEGRNIRIVAGLGLVGGAIAAAFAIRKLRETSIPYDVPHCIGFLKVPFGCRSALAGILLLGGGFVPGLSELDSLRQILACAVLLGYAQQVATRLIDKRAQTLMDAVPNKGSSRQTTASVGANPRLVFVSRIRCWIERFEWPKQRRAGKARVPVNLPI